MYVFQLLFIFPEMQGRNLYDYRENYNQYLKTSSRVYHANINSILLNFS